MIVVVARHRLRPEHVESFPQQLEEFTHESRRESGVVSFEWARSTDEQDVFFLIEVFKNAAAGEAHTGSEHFRRAIAVLPSLLVEPPQIIHVAADGSGWSRMAEVS